MDFKNDEGIYSAAYLAPDGFLDELVEELGEKESLVRGRLVLSRRPPRDLAWAQNTWLAPRVAHFESISQAARLLREGGRNWALYSHDFHRRAQLIQAQLPHVSAKPLAFLAPVPPAPLGSWTLLDSRTLLMSPHCRSAFPHGEVSFIEDKKRPPSRAYLKLWELFTVHGIRPRAGQVALDLGSSPGGWSWVLAEMGLKVLSVDKAPLAPALLKRPEITFKEQSAFALAPNDVGPVDWVFSDIICYPERLWGLMQKWRDSGLCERFVATLKFQGRTDHPTARRFLEIPGSRLLHLSHNKHELTWVREPPTQ